MKLPTKDTNAIMITDIGIAKRNDIPKLKISDNPIIRQNITIPHKKQAIKHILSPPTITILKAILTQSTFIR